MGRTIIAQIIRLSIRKGLRVKHAGISTQLDSWVYGPEMFANTTC